MLKKLKSNKKGFTLMEILVAVSILGIIVGPLLASLFSNNRVIEYARKQTEATYVAKKVMEETLADYYATVSTTIPSDHIDGMGYPACIGKLVALLGMNKNNVPYSSGDTFKSKYADNFIYNIKIVPSGKIGMGSATESGDETANYLHIYRDTVANQEYTYIVFPDGRLASTGLGNTNNFNIEKDGDNFIVEKDGAPLLSNPPSIWNNSKKDLRIVTYSSNDAVARKLNFTADYNWWDSDCDRYVVNYTSRNDGEKTTIVADTEFIETEVVEYFSSGREQWDIALYEITVTVYEKGSIDPLSSAQGVVEVRIFPQA